MKGKRLIEYGVLLLTLLALSDLAFVVYKLYNTNIDIEKPPIITPSVATFGYNNLRSGSVISSLTATNYTPLTVENVPFTEGSSFVMPVYLNGTANPFPGLENRKVIFFGGNHSFNALDIETDTIIWTVDLSLPLSYSSPVIDLKRGRLYFTASGRSGKKPNLSWAREKYRINIYTVNLDGTGLDGFEIDLDKLLYSDLVNPETGPSHVMWCRTALGLNDYPDSHYVFFGCSMDYYNDPYHYANSRGARGILIAVYLDDEGNLLGPDFVSTYTPSKLTLNTKTGFDSGIWNTGAGPSLLPDNSLLIASGNGPLIAQEENYGCSVVRLDGIQLTPSAKTPDGFPFYSVDNQGYSECHAVNADLGSSSVGSFEKDGQVYSVITGKDGKLKSFNPYDLPGYDPSKKIELKIGGALFGQPAVLLDTSGKIQVVAGGNRSHRFLRRGKDYVLATESESEFLESQGHKKTLCIGLIKKQRGPQAIELSLHHSGPLRGDYTLLQTGTIIQKLITDGEFLFRDWRECVGGNQTGKLGPFKKLKNVGYAFSTEADGAPPGYEFIPLGLYSSVRGGIYSFPESLPQDKILEFEQELPKNFNGYPLIGRNKINHKHGLILVNKNRDREGYCGQYANPNYTRLYLHERDAAEDHQGWTMSAFNINPDYNMVPKWTYHRNDGTEYPNSNLVTTYSNNGVPGLVIFVVEGTYSSYLVLLNSETGKLVDQIDFGGRVKFTMPLVIDEKIYLATTNRLKVFKRPRDFLDLYKRHSVLAKLFRKIGSLGARQQN